MDSCSEDGSLLNESSGSNASSCKGDGGRMGSGFSGVFGRKLLRESTKVERLPKLRACDRLVRLVVFDIELMVLDAEENMDDRVSMDIACAFGRNGERGGRGGEASGGGDEGSDEPLQSL